MINLTQQFLQDLFIYQPETGWLLWRVDVGRRGKAGTRAGSFGADGYRCIQIAGQKYKEHRLIWRYVTGAWPVEIDHRDGDGFNNIWLNLREATRSENTANSNRAVGDSGLRGVIRDPRNPTLWRARVSFRNHREWLGPYDSPEEAHKAYLLAAEDTHGEYALHNRPTPLGV